MLITFYIFTFFTLAVYITNLILILRAWYTHEEDKWVEESTPKVSIISPAYNEELNIVQSIKSISQQNYPDFDIIIVDDGSVDKTSDVLIDEFNLKEISPNVWENGIIKLIQKENGGKASALNMGFGHSDAEYILSVDADTILNPDTIKTLIGKKRKNADAVTCIVGIVNENKIGSDYRLDNPTVPRNLVTRIQWIEYFKTYTMFRCSVKEFNSIVVMPGACALISSDMMRKTGGYKENTLGEDMELTLNIHRNGGNIQFISDVLAWTESPESLSNLGLQRVRWFRGLLQSMVSYRDLLFKKGNKLLSLFMSFVWISDIFGAWVELLAWVVLGVMLLFDMYIDWNYLLILWGSLLSLYYINFLLVIGFLKHKLSPGRKTNKLYRFPLLALFEGVSYHFLYLFWSLKAHTRELLSLENEWNRVKRLGQLKEKK